MKIIRNIIILCSISLTSCTFKSTHHITIDHNIKLKIDETTKESFLDKLRSSQDRYDANMLAIKERYTQNSLNLSIDELHSGIE